MKFVNTVKRDLAIEQLKHTLELSANTLLMVHKGKRIEFYSIKFHGLPHKDWYTSRITSYIYFILNNKPVPGSIEMLGMPWQGNAVWESQKQRLEELTGIKIKVEQI